MYIVCTDGNKSPKIQTDPQNLNPPAIFSEKKISQCYVINIYFLPSACVTSKDLTVVWIIPNSTPLRHH